MAGGDIPFTRRAPAPDELDYVRTAIESGNVAGDGPFTARVTAALESLTGVPVLLTTSCTHALELAALLLEIGPGDEVVVPSFTFASTANAFALRGARIRFADVSPETFSMEAPELEAALTERTAAVCAVPYGGVSRDIAAIAEICRSRSIALVEDAAQALFARAGDRPHGTFGRLGALSFHATKNVSCGEGGALLINDRSLTDRAAVLREKGTDRSRFLRGEVDRYTWQTIGSSYLPSDVLAAMLCAQLEHATATQARRRVAWDLYRERLAGPCERHGIRLQVIPDGHEHPAHLFALVAPDTATRNRIVDRLATRSIHAVTHFEPLHLAPAAGGDRRGLANVEALGRGLLRLPLYNDITEAEVGRVADAVIAALKQEA
jgi:dTDP-4-amino-4,6-dideoxygalactose transaminase